MTTAAGPDTRDSLGHTALYTAIERGDVEDVRRLLGAGADPNAPQSNSFPCLCLAAVKGHAGIVGLLIGAKADIHFRHASGWSAFDLAVGYGNLESAKLLAAAGADIHETTKDALRSTPLMLAAAPQLGETAASLATVAWLLEQGARLGDKDFIGRIAEQRARQEGLSRTTTLLASAATREIRARQRRQAVLTRVQKLPF